MLRGDEYPGVPVPGKIAPGPAVATGRFKCRLAIHFIDPEGLPQLGELRMTNGASKLRRHQRVLRGLVLAWLSVQGAELVSIQLHDDE